MAPMRMQRLAQAQNPTHHGSEAKGWTSSVSAFSASRLRGPCESRFGMCHICMIIEKKYIYIHIYICTRVCLYIAAMQGSKHVMSGTDDTVPIFPTQV